MKKNHSTQVAIYFENATSSIPVTVMSSNSDELSVNPSSSTVPLGGYSMYTLTSEGNNAGFTYDVTFRSACGDITVRVSVTNGNN